MKKIVMNVHSSLIYNPNKALKITKIMLAKMQINQ